MKFFKNKRGSELVSKILVAGFAVAAGGAVIVYGSETLVNAKNTEITGILGNGGQGQMTQEQIDAHFDDNGYVIHLTAQEVNTKSFSNLTSTIRNIGDSEMQSYNYLNSSSVIIDGKNYPKDEICLDTSGRFDSYICYYCGETDYGLFIGTVMWNWGTFSGISLFDESNNVPFTKTNVTGTFTWNTNNEDFYNLIKPAIIADLS